MNRVEQKQERNPLPLSEAQGGGQLHDKDHIHVLFRGQPNSEISKFINAYKSASSRLIKKEYPEIKKHLWKDMFWSQSYCLISTGGVTVDIIKEYIQTQGRR